MLIKPSCSHPLPRIGSRPLPSLPLCCSPKLGSLLLFSLFIHILSALQQFISSLSWFQPLGCCPFSRIPVTCLLYLITYSWVTSVLGIIKHLNTYPDPHNIILWDYYYIIKLSFYRWEAWCSVRLRVKLHPLSDEARIQSQAVWL